MADQTGGAGWVPRLGDRVTVRGPLPMRGRVVDLRGNLGPGGVDVFGVELANSSRSYIEVLADQLTLLEDEAPAPQPVPSAWE